jgi:hypothetical protein
MGYGYAETFLIIFLTHPGVIIPTAGSALNKVTSYVPADFQELVPKGNVGFSPIMSGLWQVFWAWVLNLPGEKSAALGWTMYSIYLFFLFLYMYLFGRMRMTQGI